MSAYEPSGAGDHLFVRFTKKNLTTMDAVRQLARACDVSAKDIGIAGLKDKVAVTTQTISLPIARGDDGLEKRVLDATIDGITIVEAKRHGNKLKTGHLAANRFTLVVRDVPEAHLGAALEGLERVGRQGVPNGFGGQRFGHRGDNVQRALGWLSGREPAPRDARLRRLHWSAVQSAIFNAVLDARVADGTWATPMAGDILKKHESGGLFLCEDVETDRARAATGEVSPTGPIMGVKMRAAEGEVRALEERCAAALVGDSFDWSRTKALGEGTRRALRLWVKHLEAMREGFDIKVRFVLPKGSYATTVLESVFDLGAPHADEETRNEET